MSLVGAGVQRDEDPVLLTAGGHYVDDLGLDSSLHAAFVRSTVAHAELGSIHTDDAAAAPGVAGVFTAADLGITPLPPATGPAQPENGMEPAGRGAIAIRRRALRRRRSGDEDGGRRRSRGRRRSGAAPDLKLRTRR